VYTCLMNPIDKVAWILIKDKKVLFVRGKNKDVYYTPGGKREAGETDVQTLLREIKEEVDVKLVPNTITYLQTFKAQAHGKPEGVMVEIKCHTAEYVGTLKAAAEIEELQWLTSADIPKTTGTGILILNWLKENKLID
jgi:8-oxo-dGTP diphosphatase